MATGLCAREGMDPASTPPPPGSLPVKGREQGQVCVPSLMGVLARELPVYEALLVMSLLTEVEVLKVCLGWSSFHGRGHENHLIITMIKWIRTSRLSISNSLCGRFFLVDALGCLIAVALVAPQLLAVFSQTRFCGVCTGGRNKTGVHGTRKISQ